LIWIGTHTYALSNGDTSFRWQTATTTTPTVSVTAELLKGPIALSTDTSGVIGIDPSTGKITARYRVPAPPVGSMIYPVGTGLLVAGPHTVVYR
jgi:hypothetical protein